MHDIRKAYCYYSPRSCKVNPYRLTWPLNDIQTEIEIPFLPPKLESYIWIFGMWQWVPFTEWVHQQLLEFFLFILSHECCFIIISSSLPNTQPRFCMSTFHPLLSVRSVCLMHRWCESAEALRLAADSQSMLLAFQVLDQSLELNWDEWLVRETGLWFELSWSRGNSGRLPSARRNYNLGVIFCWTHYRF